MTEQPAAEDSSLEQIEGDVWGDPAPGATDLVTTVHRLRRKPVGALTAEDLRMLVAQQVGLDVLVPRALAGWNAIRCSKATTTRAMCWSRGRRDGSGPAQRRSRACAASARATSARNSPSSRRRPVGTSSRASSASVRSSVSVETKYRG